ncbi:MAG: homoserine dehydrogenase [Oscillospiraceae bacterium]|nr:homoserine dehydrogenase [Oscillospiraceae bacterium]
MKHMKTALLGYGTVGGGVFRIIEGREDLQVKYVLDLREFPELGDRLVHDFETIVNDPEIETVFEAMGGLHPAYEFATACLKAGKSYVTANKHLVSHYYNELTQAAQESGACLRCTAAAGGSIPWLINLERARRVDRIMSLQGIMNGTTNYILDSMLHNGITFADALAQAQALGYAEANPAADIDGLDIQRKLIISANVAYDCLLTDGDVPVVGIRNITDGDIRSFTEAGYVCKLVAAALPTADGVAAWVEPTLLPARQMMAAVPANFNLITYTGEYAGEQSYYGQGAGRFPTAFNMVEDCIDILNGARGFYGSLGTPVPQGSACHPYYVRTTVRADWLDEITDRRLGDGVVTKPVSHLQMHAFLASIVEEDPDAFIAGIR